MYYVAEIGNLGFIIALIWFIVSSLLNKNKKKSDESISTDQIVEKDSIFDFNKLIENLKTTAQSHLNNNNIQDVEILDDNDNIDENKNSETKVKNISREENNQKTKNEISLTETKQRNLFKKSLYYKLRNKNELQQAIIFKEILDKPVSLKKFFKQ